MSLGLLQTSPAPLVASVSNGCGCQAVARSDLVVQQPAFGVVGRSVATVSLGWLPISMVVKWSRRENGSRWRDDSGLGRTARECWYSSSGYGGRCEFGRG